MILKAITIYWKSIFIILYPLALLPFLLYNNTEAVRCLYVVLLMAGYWMLDVLPLAVTSLLPIVLFPLLGVMDSDKVSICYLKETNMMLIGGCVIAIAVEHCNLHLRVALYVIKWVGCSPRRLNFGLATITMLVSLWISNAATTAMMIPIIEATLKELESQGMGNMYEDNHLPLHEKDEKPRKPTKITMCYFISTAYAASIGGNGCLIGSASNLSFKGIFETIFPSGPEIELTEWMLLNVPIMAAMMYISLAWMQFLYMGLFRPNSEDAKKIKAGKQCEIITTSLIEKKIKQLGPMSFHEMAIASLFLLSIIFWIFRKPQFVTGWAELIAEHKIKDSVVAFAAVILLFIIPSKPDFLHIFNEDPQERPKAPSQALLTWKILQEKMPWGIIFLLGGGFALAEASKQSGMNQLIVENLHGITLFPKFYIMLICCLFVTFLTQFCSNVSVANLILPVLAEVSLTAKIHPLYLMLPASLCCSFAFCLPVSTPPNAIAAEPCNMSSGEMVKVGLGVAFICLLVLFVMFPLLASVVWDIHSFPEWAIKQ